MYYVMKSVWEYRKFVIVIKIITPIERKTYCVLVNAKISLGNCVPVFRLIIFKKDFFH